MTKRELIKEAWRGKNDKINEDGWLYFGYACNGWDDVEDWLEDNNLITDESYYDMTCRELDNGDLISVKIRPKSLQGIEDNNGWIRIESEDDLPKTSNDFLVYNKEKEILIKPFIPRSIISSVWLQEITHYQSIQKPEPPLY